MKICSLLLLFIVTLHAQDKSGTWAQKRTIPRWAQQEFKSHSLGRNYAVTYQLYPSYFRGDFNGDGRRDAVILVAQNSTGKLGMLFIHGKYPQDMRTAYYILGAGKAFGFGDDIKAITSWSFIPESKADQMLGTRGLPAFSGDVIKTERKDGTKGLIYWSGRRYEWFRLGK